MLGGCKGGRVAPCCVKRLRAVFIIALGRSGSTHLLRVLNSVPRGGMHAYVDVYKHFTETSGQGLAAQARKLMDLDPARKEDEISDRVEDFIPKMR